MPARTTGSRLDLGEPLATELVDFCEAHRGAPAIRIIRDALREFIDNKLAAETELRRRYDQAREKRLAKTSKTMRLVRPDD